MPNNISVALGYNLVLEKEGGLEKTTLGKTHTHTMGAVSLEKKKKERIMSILSQSGHGGSAISKDSPASTTLCQPLRRQTPQASSVLDESVPPNAATVCQTAAGVRHRRVQRSATPAEPHRISSAGGVK